MFLVQMPERRESLPLPSYKRTSLIALVYGTEVLTVPRNMKLVALPLFELYDNSVR